MSVVFLNMSQFSIRYIWKRLRTVFLVFSNSELKWETLHVSFYGSVIFNNAKKTGSDAGKVLTGLLFCGLKNSLLLVGGSGGMLSQIILKIYSLNLAQVAFESTWISLNFEINLCTVYKNCSRFQSPSFCPRCLSETSIVI